MNNEYPTSRVDIYETKIILIMNSSLYTVKNEQIFCCFLLETSYFLVRNFTKSERIWHFQAIARNIRKFVHLFP